MPSMLEVNGVALLAHASRRPQSFPSLRHVLSAASRSSPMAPALHILSEPQENIRRTTALVIRVHRRRS
ncbi:hypothetical protein K523DRAFT_322737 [Schizophyllum commune Tattone D]|nr:hypothetical protein K523DRAFT_322737 [Schizophyllum commune Tattone D]